MSTFVRPKTKVVYKPEHIDETGMKIQEKYPYFVYVNGKLYGQAKTEGDAHAMIDEAITELRD